MTKLQTKTKVASRKDSGKDTDFEILVLDKATGAEIGTVREIWEAGTRTEIKAWLADGTEVEAGATRARTVAAIRKALS